ncbi:MAG TPA: hypothetical protein VFE76_00875, partial [Myxococcales bacterium]|nr:hypothetical protein [Myxococcales bacterium]
MKHDDKNKKKESPNFVEGMRAERRRREKHDENDEQKEGRLICRTREKESEEEEDKDEEDTGRARPLDRQERVLLWCAKSDIVEVAACALSWSSRCFLLSFSRKRASTFPG